MLGGENPDGLQNCFPGHFEGNFIIGLAWINFKIDAPVKYFNPACDILEAQTLCTLIQFIELSLNDAFTIVMNTKIEVIATGILSEMDKTCIAVFDDVVHQLLDNPENQ